MPDNIKKEKFIKYFQLIEKDEDFLIKFIKILENINFKNDLSFDFCIEKYAKTIEDFFKSENKNLLLNFIFSKNYSYNHSILLLKATKLLLAIYKNAIPKNKVEKECNYAINYVNEHEIEMVFIFLENKDDIKEFKEKCNLIILENTAQLEKEKIEENFVINKEFDNNKKRL